MNNGDRLREILGNQDEAWKLAESIGEKYSQRCRELLQAMEEDMRDKGASLESRGMFLVYMMREAFIGMCAVMDVPMDDRRIMADKINSIMLKVADHMEGKSTENS